MIQNVHAEWSLQKCMLRQKGVWKWNSDSHIGEHDNIIVTGLEHHYIIKKYIYIYKEFLACIGFDCSGYKALNKLKSRRHFKNLFSVTTSMKNPIALELGKMYYCDMKIKSCTKAVLSDCESFWGSIN